MFKRWFGGDSPPLQAAPSEPSVEVKGHSRHSSMNPSVSILDLQPEQLPPVSAAYAWPDEKLAALWAIANEVDKKSTSRLQAFYEAIQQRSEPFSDKNETLLGYPKTMLSSIVGELLAQAQIVENLLTTNYGSMEPDDVNNSNNNDEEIVVMNDERRLLFSVMTCICELPANTHYIISCTRLLPTILHLVQTLVRVFEKHSTSETIQRALIIVLRLITTCFDPINTWDQPLIPNSVDERVHHWIANALVDMMDDDMQTFPTVILDLLALCGGTLEANTNTQMTTSLERSRSHDNTAALSYIEPLPTDTSYPVLSSWQAKLLTTTLECCGVIVYTGPSAWIEMLQQGVVRDSLCNVLQYSRSLSHSTDELIQRQQFDVSCAALHVLPLFTRRDASDATALSIREHMKAFLMWVFLTFEGDDEVAYVTSCQTFLSAGTERMDIAMQKMHEVELPPLGFGLESIVPLQYSTESVTHHTLDIGLGSKAKLIARLFKVLRAICYQNGTVIPMLFVAQTMFEVAGSAAHSSSDSKTKHSWRSHRVLTHPIVFLTSLLAEAPDVFYQQNIAAELQRLGVSDLLLSETCGFPQVGAEVIVKPDESGECLQLRALVLFEELATQTTAYHARAKTLSGLSTLYVGCLSTLHNSSTAALLLKLCDCVCSMLQRKELHADLVTAFLDFNVFEVTLSMLQECLSRGDEAAMLRLALLRVIFHMHAHWDERRPELRTTLLNVKYADLMYALILQPTDAPLWEVMCRYASFCLIETMKSFSAAHGCDDLVLYELSAGVTQELMVNGQYSTFIEGNTASGGKELNLSDDVKHEALNASQKLHQRFVRAKQNMFACYLHVVQTCKEKSRLLILLGGIEQLCGWNTKQNPQRPTAKEFRENQIVLKDLSAFGIMSNMLLNNPSARDEDIRIAILWSIAALLSRNVVNEQYFRKTFGFTALGSHFFGEHSAQGEEIPVTMDMFHALFDLLLSSKGRAKRDALSETMEKIPLIRNAPALKIIFSSQILKLPSKEQISIFSYYLKFLESSLVNQRLSCAEELHLLNLLLDLLPHFLHFHELSLDSDDFQVFQKLVDVIMVVASFNITVSQFSKLFSLLRSHAVTFDSPADDAAMVLGEVTQCRPAFGAYFIHALEGMTQSLEGAKNFLYLTGVHSGLVLPKMVQYPCEDGWAISLWVRFESFESQYQYSEPNPLPCIFSFGAEESKSGDVSEFNDGFMAYIEDSCLRIEIASVDNPQTNLSVHLNKRPWKTHQWYHLVVSQVAHASFFRKKSTVNVYVNGVCETQTPLKGYPAYDDGLSANFLGTMNTQGKHGMHGELGPFYMFREPLSADDVELLYLLGNSYANSFDYSTLIPALNTMQQRQGTPRQDFWKWRYEVEHGRMSQKICVSYNARAHESQQTLCLLDTTPFIDESLRRNAHALRGTVQCVSRKLVDVFVALGGISVLFPLLVQLGQPVISIHESGEKQKALNWLTESQSYLDEKTHTLSYDCDLSYLPSVLKLLINIVHTPTIVRVNLEKQDLDLDIVVFYLERCSPFHFTPQVIGLLDDLLAGYLTSGRLRTTERFRRVFWKFLGNFRLFTYCSTEVRTQWLETFSGYVKIYPEILRKEGGLLKLLDNLRRYCLFEDDNGTFNPGNSRDLNISVDPSSNGGQRILYHPVTDEVIGERADNIEIARIRSILLSLIPDDALLGGDEPDAENLRYEEARVFVSHVYKSKSEREKEDLLGVLLRLLVHHPDVLKLFNGIHKEAWASKQAVEHPNLQEEIKLSVLNESLGITIAPQTPQTAGGNGVVSFFVSLFECRRSKIHVLACQGISRLIRSGHPIDGEKVFPNVLMALRAPSQKDQDLLSEELYLALLSLMLQEDIHEDNIEHVRHEMHLKEAKLATSACLPLLFFLISRCRNVKLMQDILQDMTFLLSKDENKEIVMARPGWELWFFTLMVEPLRQLPLMYKRRKVRPRTASQTYSASPLDLSPMKDSKRRSQSVHENEVLDRDQAGILLSIEAIRMYAFTIVESILFFALKRRKGWQYYERVVVTLVERSTALSPTDSKTGVLIEDRLTGLPLCHVLHTILTDIHKLTQREEQKLANMERRVKRQFLGMLVRNLVSVCAITKDVLLYHVHSMSIPPAPNAPVLPTQHLFGNEHEMGFVWPLVGAIGTVAQYIQDKRKERIFAAQAAAASQAATASAVKSSATKSLFSPTLSRFDVISTPSRKNSEVQPPATNSPTTDSSRQEGFTTPKRPSRVKADHSSPSSAYQASASDPTTPPQKEDAHRALTMDADCIVMALILQVFLCSLSKDPIDNELFRDYSVAQVNDLIKKHANPRTLGALASSLKEVATTSLSQLSPMAAPFADEDVTQTVSRTVIERDRTQSTDSRNSNDSEGQFMPRDKYNLLCLDLYSLLHLLFETIYSMHEMSDQKSVQEIVKRNDTESHHLIRAYHGVYHLVVNVYTNICDIDLLQDRFNMDGIREASSLRSSPRMGPLPAPIPLELDDLDNMMLPDSATPDIAAVASASLSPTTSNDSLMSSSSFGPKRVRSDGSIAATFRRAMRSSTELKRLPRMLPLSKDVIAAPDFVPDDADCLSWLFACESTFKSNSSSANAWGELMHKIQAQVGKHRLDRHEGCQRRIGMFTIAVNERTKVKRKQQNKDDAIIVKQKAAFAKLSEQFALREDARRKLIRSQLRRDAVDKHSKMQALTQYLTTERGPWSRRFFGKDSTQRVFWKLGMHENKYRMRLRLERNPQGSEHREASVEPSKKDRKMRSRSDSKVAKDMLQFMPSSMVPNALVGDGEEEEEEDLSWTEPKATATVIQELAIKGDVGFQVSMLQPDYKMPGKLNLTQAALVFECNLEDGREDKRNKYHEFHNATSMYDREWQWSDIRAIHYRRYTLQQCALELFFENGHSNAFFVFEDEKTRMDAHTKLVRYASLGRQLASKADTRADRKRVEMASPMKKRNVNPAMQALPVFSQNLNKALRYDYHYSGRGFKAPKKVLKRSDLTKAWRLRKISNFDYLMHLNTIAGRTYNDLTQYPVFPWVLSDYTSSELDLNDPSVYRDFTKPIGALNEDRLAVFDERFKSMSRDKREEDNHRKRQLEKLKAQAKKQGKSTSRDDLEKMMQEPMCLPPFHYGTHYSTSGSVLFYLVRVEPYATQAIALHDGKFNLPDRMFASMAKTWAGVTRNAADVKELIPEFFFLPEMFCNQNNFDFGFTQDESRGKLNDVELPPWASSPDEFVRIHRLALESEHVSANLHHWIDLIFGHKQRGEEAEKAHNVFFYLTYEGNVDLDKIESESLRDARISQIEYYGQTPSQVLTKPHPKRCSLDELNNVPSSIFGQLDEIQRYVVHKVTQDFKTTRRTNPLLFIGAGNDKIVTVGLDRMVSLHQWKNSTPESVAPFMFIAEKPGSGDATRQKHRRRVGVHFANGLKISPFFFVISADHRFITTCGHWDNSIRVCLLETGKQVACLSGHSDVVSCIALSQNGDVLASGSKDTTVVLWNVTGGDDWIQSTASPAHVLYGHDEEVTCVAYNANLDLVVSGARDGVCLIHTASDGQYLRTLCTAPPTAHGNLHQSAVRWVGVSEEGLVVVYSHSTLRVFTINGRHLATAFVKERLHALLISSDGRYLVTGGSAELVKVRNLHDLKVEHVFDETQSTIRSLYLTDQEQHLLVGLETGHVVIYSLNTTYLRNLFLQQLENLGF